MHEHFHSPQLRDRGYEGSNQDVWRQWLNTKGFVGRTTAGLEKDWLNGLGYSGPLNDMYLKMYRDAGLTGALDDMGSKWIVPEGGTTPEGEPIEDPLWSDVLFFHDFTTIDPITGGIGEFQSNTTELIPEGVFNVTAVSMQPVNNQVSGIQCIIPPITLSSVDGFTVDCWGKTIDIGPGNWPTWMELYSGSETSYYGSSDVRGFTTGGFFGYHPSGSNTIPHDDWTHVAYVFGEGRVKIFSEGKLIHNSALSPLSHSFDSVMIGSRINSAYPYVFKGKLSQVRITKGMRWTEDFTPPSGPVKVPAP